MGKGNTKRSFAQLSISERRLIEGKVRKGIGVRQIARDLEREPSSISRELRRAGCTVHVLEKRKWVDRYSASMAHADAYAGRRVRGAKCKFFLFEEMVKEVEAGVLQNRWSPDTILGGAKFTGFTSRTFYNWVDKGLTRVKPHDLLHKVGRKRVKMRVRPLKKPKIGDSIEIRPPWINSREEFGHWEGDCVVDGSNHAILVLQERKSRNCILRKLEKHDSRSVNEEVMKLKSDYKFKSITVDNGIEFYKMLGFGFPVYSCHPYCAHEKGSVENLNGIIRRYIPKGANLSFVTAERLQQIEATINSMPRKILDYNSASAVYTAGAA